MTKSNLAYACGAYSCNEAEWNLPCWDYLIEETVKVFRLTKTESERLKNSVTAKIIATIPFEAKCKEPERTAVAHLCLYVAELQGFQKYCAHNVSDDDDIFNRLAFISTFEGGNKEIIHHGMNILALIMLEGYKKSAQKDSTRNVYNPLNSGKWDYQQIKNRLLWEINKIEVPNIDWIFRNIPLNHW